ncbi:hypothetical protein DPPLL_32490 [Desulfofustis limnaeus]|uniref:Uncharacterized protein n=1 Tax=Desulfofustis limnaeus TaxID=2740163 RepID=A0ABN6MA22_9BACT|nr:hypothetical protein DPPLL_32490 [Desulfofustis limnaeus]
MIFGSFRHSNNFYHLGRTKCCLLLGRIVQLIAMSWPTFWVFGLLNEPTSLTMHFLSWVVRGFGTSVL